MSKLKKFVFTFEDAGDYEEYFTYSIFGVF